MKDISGKNNHYPSRIDYTTNYPVNSRSVICILILLSLLLNACGEGAWNNPYPSQKVAKGEQAEVIYSSFSERPKRLDPVSSYLSLIHI